MASPAPVQPFTPQLGSSTSTYPGATGSRNSNPASGGGYDDYSTKPMPMSNGNSGGTPGGGNMNMGGGRDIGGGGMGAAGLFEVI